MKNHSLLALFMLFTFSSFGQYFATAADGFSKKKPAYVTLKTGEEVVGTIKDFDWKKGLIDEVTIEVSKKNKRKLTPDMIAHAYFPQSGLSKLADAIDLSEDATMWGSEDINQEHMKGGYAYFEQSVVQFKRKQVNALLQLINPAFNNPVKIFYDAYAGETASAGIGGIKVAGGIAKSYWVVIGDEVAFKVEKKSYDEQLEQIYGKCPGYISKLGDKPKWNDFPEALFNYSKECK